MTTIRINLETSVWPFPGPQVTWAGEFPWLNRLCFGKEDGSLEYRDVQGKSPFIDPNPQNLCAINGVAFTSNPKMAACSTRNEILIQNISTNGSGPQSIMHPRGAHGVIATHRGGFMAPLGVAGGILFESIAENLFRNRSFKSAERDLYFYKLAHVGVTERGAEIIACAGRNDGLLTITVNADGTLGPLGMSAGRISGFDIQEDIDIIDVCPITSNRFPFAVLALGIDGTLHFTPDVRHENPSFGLRLREMEGTAYSLMTVRGHIFVLTSEEFYILPDLGSLFLTRGPFNGKVGALRVPVEALDCSIAYGEYVLLIVEGGVAMLEISKLLPTRPFVADEPSQVGKGGILNNLDEMTSDPIDSAWEATVEHTLDVVAL